MATNHIETRSGRAGASHCDYVCGVGKYGSKEEVSFVEAGNLPDFAKTARDFFKQAEENERANGRTYRGLIIAIPNEAEDKIKWCQELVKSIVKDQTYLFGIHLLDGNPHMHLMFSERTNTRDLQPDKYFSRCNKKIREFTKKSWMNDTKEKYLEAVKKVAPDYKPKPKPTKPKKRHQFKAYQKKQIKAAQAIQNNKNHKRLVMNNFSAFVQENRPTPKPQIAQTQNQNDGLKALQDKLKKNAQSYNQHQTHSDRHVQRVHSKMESDKALAEAASAKNESMQAQIESAASAAERDRLKVIYAPCCR